jgi:hypothetical protein
MLITFVLLVTCVAGGFAQLKDAEAAMMQGTKGSLPFGFGATFIDGKTFYLVNIAPEVAFGQLGIGLDINLRFDTNGKLRRGDYTKFEDYLRTIRYVRWAEKGAPLYTRVGALDYSLLGHGSIVYNYRNSASYDLRKTGIELDVNYDKFGFESVYSDVTDRGLLGLRGYVKPLKMTSLAKVPVINNFEIGATYAQDFNKTADITARDSSGRGLSIVGFDFGLPLLYYPMIKSTLYFDYAQIMHYGHGTSVGINASLGGQGLVTLRGKYELRFNGAKYLPAYFNAFYEYDRFNPVTMRSKSDTLQSVVYNRGYYGELILSVLNTINVIGGYQAPFHNYNEGLLHLELRLPEMTGILLRAAYDKAHIGKVFVYDNYTILSAEIGYKPIKYILVSTLYQRTFSNRNPDGSLRADGLFVKQDRVEPKISLVFDF